MALLEALILKTAQTSIAATSTASNILTEPKTQPKTDPKEERDETCSTRALMQ